MPLFHHPRDEADVAQGEIVSGAPFADPTLTTDHRENERIVELTRVPTRFEANVVVAALEARGIKAAIGNTDGRWMPHYGAPIGNQVVVFESDLAVAQALLAQDRAAAATDDADGVDDAEPDDVN